MKIGSLFSGYGGLEQGVQAVLGGTVAWHSEIDPGACKILAHRFPGVPNLGDITAVDWSAVEPVDVLTGGFPCQDVSAAGKRAGIRPDTRSGLWSQFAYAISQLRPSLVVIENVRGLLSADAHHPAHSDLEPCPWCMGDSEQRPLRALGAVLGELADLGYDASWQGLRASDVGAPHGRFRVFVVAWPSEDADVAAGGERWVAAPGQAQGGWARADAGGRGGAPAADAHGGPVRQQPIALTGRSGEAVAGLAGADADPDSARIGRRPSRRDDGVRTARLVEEPADSDGPGLEGREPAAGRLLSDGGAPANTEDDGRAPLLAGGPRAEGPWPASDSRPSADADCPTCGQRWVAAPGQAQGGWARADAGGRSGAPYWGSFADAVRRWERVTRPAPRPTEPNKKGQPRLSARAVEWMMGLPAGWVTDVPGLGRNEQLKALGNGVVPQQAAAALRLLLPDVAVAA